jgi:hypothetical protein
MNASIAPVRLAMLISSTGSPVRASTLAFALR